MTDNSSIVVNSQPSKRLVTLPQRSAEHVGLISAFRNLAPSTSGLRNDGSFKQHVVGPPWSVRVIIQSRNWVEVRGYAVPGQSVGPPGRTHDCWTGTDGTPVNLGDFAERSCEKRSFSRRKGVSRNR